MQVTKIYLVGMTQHNIHTIPNIFVLYLLTELLCFQSWKVKNLNTTSVYYNTPVVSEIGVHSTLLLHALNAQNKCIRFQSCHVIFSTFQGHNRIFQDFFLCHLYSHCSKMNMNEKNQQVPIKLPSIARTLSDAKKIIKKENTFLGPRR